MKIIQPICRTPAKKAALLLGVIAVLAALTPSMANAEPRRVVADHDWNRHVVAAHRDWRRPHPEPAVYAPPVVYAPPPEASPGINLILPLNFN